MATPVSAIAAIGHPTTLAGTHGVTANQPSGRQAAQVHKAAQEFEGMLINNLWGSFQDDPMTADDDSDPGASTIKSMGLQAMSNAMAKSGGLGIAKMIEKQLERTPQETVQTQRIHGGLK